MLPATPMGCAGWRSPSWWWWPPSGSPWARLWRQERAARAATAGADRADLPPEQHFPVALIGLHGLLAVTLVLVLLTALGVGD